MVIGANVGIGVTALVAGYARMDTRRWPLAICSFKLAGALVCMPLLSPLVDALNPLSPSGDTQVVANAHTLFNVALALVFLPLVPLVARWLERPIPARQADEERFGPRYLDARRLRVRRWRWDRRRGRFCAWRTSCGKCCRRRTGAFMESEADAVRRGPT